MGKVEQIYMKMVVVVYTFLGQLIDKSGPLIKKFCPAI
jgi:hypothetical protein